jgi:hypothetical protein
MDKVPILLSQIQENLKTLCQFTGLQERQRKNENQYFWGDLISYTDICILPLLE